MTGRSRSRRERGMTLAELLVALTLLGMISVMMMGGLSFGARSWERAGESSDAMNGAVRLHAFMRERLSGTVRPDSAHGTADRIAFTTLWLTALGGAGLYDFELSRRDDGSVVLAWAPTPAGGEGLAGGPASRLSGERAVLDGVRALGIRYYGQPPDYPAPEWLDRWQPGWSAPLLVRVSVDFAEPGRSWPILTVALPGQS